jgi:hypothetical protein
MPPVSGRFGTTSPTATASATTRHNHQPRTITPAAASTKPDLGQDHGLIEPPGY